MQLEDFLFKRKVFSLGLNRKILSWFVKMIVFFGCKAADCLKVACVVDCLLIVFEKKRAWLLAFVWCETVSVEKRLTF